MFCSLSFCFLFDYSAYMTCFQTFFIWCLSLECRWFLLGDSNFGWSKGRCTTICVLTAHSWLYMQEMLIGVQYSIPAIEPGPAVCKPNILSAVLDLQPQRWEFVSDPNSVFCLETSGPLTFNEHFNKNYSLSFF